MSTNLGLYFDSVLLQPFPEPLHYCREIITFKTIFFLDGDPVALTVLLETTLSLNNVLQCLIYASFHFEEPAQAEHVEEHLNDDSVHNALRDSITLNRLPSRCLVVSLEGCVLGQQRGVASDTGETFRIENFARVAASH